jgi:DNA-directed RNA polymerase specialized sigma24 family protein
MSDNRWQRIEDIFHRALELPPEARSAFLNEVCATDQSLRQEVESLLAHESEDGSTFVGTAETSRFPTTSWSLIANARHPQAEISREALGRLCGGYWFPIYAFIRRKGLDSEQARDCTQDFFAALLERQFLADIERARGRFRSFLLASVCHFLSNRGDAERALKRGGGRRLLPLELETAEGIYRKEPAHALTPEALFEYHWATGMLDRVLKRLRAGYEGDRFDSLKPFLLGEAARGESTAVAEQLGLSEGAFKTAIHRLRKRYREILRAEIAETVADPAQVEDEIRYLLAALTRGTEKGM